MRSPSVLAVLLPLALALPAAAQPLSSAFTFQGELTNASTPASGPHDFIFLLFDSPGGNVQLGPTLCVDNLAVQDGRFTASLDFGAQFNGQTRYLEIRARADTGLTCVDNANFVTLTPRTTLTAAPNAAFALTAAAATSATQLNGQPASFYTNAANLTSGSLPSARLGGVYSGALSFTNAGNDYAGNGFSLTGLNASNIAAGLLSPSRGGTGANTSAATLNQVLKWNGSAWAPGTDTDTNTTYTAGSGLTLAGNVFSIPAAGLNSDFLGLSSVIGGFGGVVGDDTINHFDLATDALSLAKVSGGALSSSAGVITATGASNAADFNYTAPQTAYCMVTPASFTARDGAVVFQSNGPEGGVYPNTNCFAGLAASINLPHGATITAVHYYVVDNSATADFSMTIYRQNPSGGAINPFATIGTTGASAAVQDLTVPGVNLAIDNSQYNYRVVAATTTVWSGISLYVRGVRIDYTMPRPAR